MEYKGHDPSDKKDQSADMHLHQDYQGQEYPAGDYSAASEQQWQDYYAGMGAYGAPYYGYAMPYDQYSQPYPGMNPYPGYPPYGMPEGSDSSALGNPTHTVWVGGLNPSTTQNELQGIFANYGNVENIKLLPHKNCAFVRFQTIEEAIRAHSSMQGRYISGQQVKIGWGKPDSVAPKEEKEVPGPPPCKNLWLGNIDAETKEEHIKQLFERFGPIEKVKILGHKNCAFVNFERLESALEAKKQMQGTMFKGKPLRVNFGKSQDGAEDEVGAPGASTVQPTGPPDQDTKNVIEKLASFVVKHGPSFEDMIREKHKGDPKFRFLVEGAEYYDYFKWKIFETRQLQNKIEGKTVVPWTANPRAIIPDAIGPALDEAEQSSLSQILDTLSPTKDSIKRGKDYIMVRPEKASSIAHFMCKRLTQTPDFTAKLNIIYLANDLLHHSSKQRSTSSSTDSFGDAFMPYLSTMLNSAYTNQDFDNQQKVEKLLLIWKTKQIYPEDIISQLEKDMKEPPASQLSPSSAAAAAASSPPWSSTGGSPAPRSQQKQGAYHAVPPPPSLGGYGMPQPSMIQKQQGERLMNSLDTLLSASKQNTNNQYHDRNERPNANRYDRGEYRERPERYDRRDDRRGEERRDDRRDDRRRDDRRDDRRRDDDRGSRKRKRSRSSSPRNYRDNDRGGRHR